jgi:hypothetical protein
MEYKKTNKELPKNERVLFELSRFYNTFVDFKKNPYTVVYCENSTKTKTTKKTT